MRVNCCPRVHLVRWGDREGDLSTGGAVTAFVAADTGVAGSASLDAAAFASFAGRLTRAIAAAITSQRRGRCGT